MNFNSFSFLLLFLPVALSGFYLLRQMERLRWSIFWLIGVSLFFYGAWDLTLTCVLVGSVLTNYALGRFFSSNRFNKINSKKVLCLGVIYNLGVLIFFKYCGLYGGIQPQVFTSVFQPSVFIPIAVSFFVFQQIIYLVEIWQGKLEEKSFLDYFLYVAFFPQLLNGPIIRPNEFFPQLEGKKFLKVHADRFAAGLTIFSCGLFKKIILADGIARYSNSAFDAVAQGAVLSFEEAWSGALSFSLQIYFDFSGYSDMAIGLGCLFGIRLPVNFESPYKASSFIEFWRRWHISLSRFVRDYIYIPLGGNYKGLLNQTGSIFIIMLVGGIWHGTGYTFIVWGGLHGICLAINHFWRQLRKWKDYYSSEEKNFVSEVVGRIITFSTVVVLWVFFRAENLDIALSIIQSLFGFHTSPEVDFNNIKINEDRLWFLIIIVWFAPNMREIMSKYYKNEGFSATQYSLEEGRCWYHWHPSTWWAAFTAILFIMSLLEVTQSRPFIYFQF